MGNDSVIVIRVLNVNSERVIIINRVDQLEEMEHIDTDDDLLLGAFVELKVGGCQKQVSKDGVRLVHVNDSNPIRLERNIGFQQNIL